MALTTPILTSPIAAFDATVPYTFTFSVGSGSTQVTQNRLVIKNNTTLAEVYNAVQTTFKYEHTLPAGTLTNGTNYQAIISTLDASGVESSGSIPVQFWCYTTPVLAFTNIPTGNIIPNASFNFAFSYTQAQNEPLNSYIVNLYNAYGTLISTSGAQYTGSSAVPYTGNFLFAGFEDATAYSIEIVGTALQGSVVTSGLISITAHYTKPDIYTLVELTNNCSGGYVSIKSNITLIEGTSNPSPPIYIEDKEVDLTGINSWVMWNEGYIINGDLAAKLWFRDPNPMSTLLTFANDDGDTIILSYCEGYINDDDTTTKLAYMTAKVVSITGMVYFIYSDYIPILASTAYYNVWLTRSNGVYQLQFVAA